MKLIRSLIVMALAMIAVEGVARAQTVVIPGGGTSNVPAGLPSTVTLTQHGFWVDASVTIDVYAGTVQFTNNRTGATVNDICKVLWIGDGDYRSLHVFGFKTIIFVSNARGLWGWVDICSQTGQVAYLSTVFNETISDQCGGVLPPLPSKSFVCLTSGVYSLRYQKENLLFTLTISGHQAAAGGFTKVFDDQSGFQVLRAPGIDRDLTVVINGENATVIFSEHKQVVATFSGPQQSCQ